jgi:putative membrane protein insertion efficiency factor
MIIRTYQLILSPILKTNCRYLPTCSEYSLESLKKHGLKNLQELMILDLMEGKLVLGWKMGKHQKKHYMLEE